MDAKKALLFLDRSIGYEDRFEKHTRRLFIDTSTGWDVQFHGTAWDDGNGHNAPDGPQSCSIGDLSQLQDIIQIFDRKPSAQCFIVQQSNSWDRFKISWTGFLIILGGSDTYGPFFDLVSTFGLKHNPHDEGLSGFTYRVNSVIGKQLSYELCYNVQYVERHGRMDEYPWSFRNVALYQKFDEKNSTSRWILLQPPRKLKTALKNLFENTHDSHERTRQNFLLIHLLICLITEAGWRPFIADLEKEIDTLNDKALFSRVGRLAKFDYSVEFSDTQKLEQIRQRIIRASSAVNTSIRLPAGLKSILERFETTECRETDSTLLPELNMYLSRLESHRVSLQRLLQVAEGTMTLLLQILDFRHDEAINQNAIATRNLLSATHHENELMTVIARGTQRDSRTMKIVAFIAMIYLPATLVASIFNSEIVSIANGQETETTRIQIIASFSITTFLLTALTIVGAMIWDKGGFPVSMLRGRSSNSSSL